MVRFETLLELWRGIRMDAAQGVEEMPAEGLDFRPGEGFLSFRETAVHMVNASRGLTGVLEEGLVDFRDPSWRDKAKAYHQAAPKDTSGAALAAWIRDSMEELSARLAKWTPEFLAGTVQKWDGPELTRMEMLQFLREHDVSHRTQLFMYMRMNGLTPPTTRRRMAQLKK